jgi:hypothetical protein
VLGVFDGDQGAGSAHRGHRQRRRRRAHGQARGH